MSTYPQKAPALMVPVPDLSREALCALAYQMRDGDRIDDGPLEFDPLKLSEARKELLSVATVAIERALSVAQESYRAAVREQVREP